MYTQYRKGYLPLEVQHPLLSFLRSMKLAWHVQSEPLKTSSMSTLRHSFHSYNLSFQKWLTFLQISRHSWNWGSDHACKPLQINQFHPDHAMYEPLDYLLLQYVGLCRDPERHEARSVIAIQSCRPMNTYWFVICYIPLLLWLPFVNLFRFHECWRIRNIYFFKLMTCCLMSAMLKVSIEGHNKFRLFQVWDIQTIFLVTW